jgi:hypothetical protein
MRSQYYEAALPHLSGMAFSLTYRIASSWFSPSVRTHPRPMWSGLASPRLAWRERVMGAWYAIRVGGPDATAAVVDALCTSLGSLDAPPLATAAVVLACPAAVDALEHYFAADQAHDWGASGVTAAAAQYLCEHHGVTTSLPPPTPADRDVFSALVDVARRLQTA